MGASAGGGWDNEPVRAAAPHAAAINEFVTPKNILTLSTDRGDLVYCIRASGIDDKDMMTRVSVDQVVEFFLYAKEVHSLVANARSKQSGRLCNVIFANDITGTRKAPDAQFSKALTASPKSVQKRLKFTQAPVLGKLEELTVLTTDAATRKKFLGEIDNLLDDGFYATGSNM